ncbi:MAG: hypothetical protein ABI137_13585 [Antricoccus sp.]
MVVSGSCALAACLVAFGPPWLVITFGLLWGVSVIEDSAQFSALIVERANRTSVGTVLTLQLALAFAISAFTIWIVPLAANALRWQWASTVLIPGPVAGVWAMARLHKIPLIPTHTT